MNRRAFLAAGLGLVLPSLALACEPPAIYHLPFQADPAGADPADIAAFVARTRPVVRNTSLARGAPGDSSLCGGMGYISVELGLPPGAPFRFGQVGAQITLAEGWFYDHVFPKGPMMPDDPASDTLILGNAWYEGPPPQHKPLKAVFHARLVAPDGSLGPATRIVVKSIPRTGTRPEGVSR